MQMLAQGGTVAVVGSRGPVEIMPRDLMACEAAVVGVMGAWPIDIASRLYK
jgi:NADPH2:quinone reductase